MKAQYLNKYNLFLYMTIFCISYIITINLGYDSYNLFFDTVVLSIVLVIARLNTVSTYISICFLILCAFYAPIGNIYGKPTSEMIYATFQTNSLEAKEFISLIPLKNIGISIIILTFTFIFYKNRKKGNTQKLLLALFFSILLFTDYFWPSKLIVNTVSNIQNAMTEIKTYIHFSQQKQDTWQIITTSPKYQITVVIIGESVGKNYMSTYGFHENTTPWLNHASGLFFDHYVSSAAFTINSLSRSLIMNYEQDKNLANNIVTLANKAQYETYWISNQGSIGEHDTLTSVIGHSAQHIKFLKTGKNTAENKDDYDLLPYIHQAISDNNHPKIIFVHMIGSHENTCQRLFSSPDLYQKKYNQYVSCYLSSINKLDHFLQDIHSTLVVSKSSFSMLYFSDHGLYVNNQKNLVHHRTDIKSNYQVPFILMTSDIDTHQMIHTALSAYDFPAIFQWITGIQTKNLNQMNPMTTPSQQPIMIFNNQRKIPIADMP